MELVHKNVVYLCVNETLGYILKKTTNEKNYYYSIFGYDFTIEL